MGYVKTADYFADMAERIARDYKTLYVAGCFGAPMTEANKLRYVKNDPYNKAPARQRLIENADSDVFGFDCICVEKAILWDWDGSTDKRYGGAVYKSNGVPDFSVSQLKDLCYDISYDFDHIERGEVLFIPGHTGVYIGDGRASECTARWKDGVQITCVMNIGTIDGLNGRVWDWHGKLKYVDYTQVQPAPKPTIKHSFEVETVRKGDRGSSVLLMQKLLKVPGYYTGELDGDFGSKSDRAVREFQADNGLDIDGVCGGNTWSKLTGVKMLT